MCADRFLTRSCVSRFALNPVSLGTQGNRGTGDRGEPGTTGTLGTEGNRGNGDYCTGTPGTEGNRVTGEIGRMNDTLINKIWNSMMQKITGHDGPQARIFEGETIGLLSKSSLNCGYLLFLALLE